MKRYTSSRSGLFLMEIIIAILFFSVVSAFCLQIFVKSHTVAGDTRDLDRAVSEVTSAASLLQETGGSTDGAFSSVYPHLEETADAGYIYYNKNYETCRKPDSVYYMKIQKKDIDTRLCVFTLAFGKNGASGTVYQTEITVYNQYTP